MNKIITSTGKYQDKVNDAYIIELTHYSLITEILNISNHVYCTVKNFGKKAVAKDWQKKLWLRMLTCIGNRQSLINNKTKPNEAIPNIDEHYKMNSIFSRICLVSRASSTLFGDGEVHCRVHDP